MGCLGALSACLMLQLCRSRLAFLVQGCKRSTAKTKNGRFLKKLEVRVASKLLRILPEFFQEIIFPDFSLEFSVKRGQLVHLKLAY
jgi:hypothetical protein